MKEKEKNTDVAVNTSTGAEKVEEIAKAESTAPRKRTAQAKSGKPKGKKPVKKQRKSEGEQAKARVQRAIEKKEERAKRVAEKKAAAAKRAAEKKANAEKRLAEQKARVEKARAKREEEIRRRAHEKAQKRQSQARRKEERKKRREEKRASQKGYGGWIAAVVSLGVVTLTLGTVVTVGAIDMATTKQGVIANHRALTYELVGVMENVDNDLDRARISASSVQQERILTDLLVQARVAEMDLEKLSVTQEKGAHFTSFINRTGNESERMLAKLRNGGSLDERDGETLQSLYETSGKLRAALDEYAAQMCDKDVLQYLKKGEGKFSETLKGVEEITMPENRDGLQREGAGMRSGTDTQEARLQPSRAEELAALYFDSYAVKEFRCTGESVRYGTRAYTVQGYDDEGVLLYAEIDAENGALRTFNYYKPCTEENFDLDRSRMIAEEFLEKLGYGELTAVRVSENGTDGDFTFLYERDGVVYYPDSVRVKVCRTRGIVTGLDATAFLDHHRDRAELTAAVTLQEVQARLRDGLDMQHARAAVVQTLRGERLAYEFYVAYQEEHYLVYVDAQTGEELSILNVKTLG